MDPRAIRRIPEEFAPFPAGNIPPVYNELNLLLGPKFLGEFGIPGEQTKGRDIDEDYLGKVDHFIARVRERIAKEQPPYKRIFLVSELDPENPGRAIAHFKEWIDRTRRTDLVEFNQYYTFIKIQNAKS